MNYLGRTLSAVAVAVSLVSVPSVASACEWLTATGEVGWTNVRAGAGVDYPIVGRTYVSGTNDYYWCGKGAYADNGRYWYFVRVDWDNGTSGWGWVSSRVAETN